MLVVRRVEDGAAGGQEAHPVVELDLLEFCHRGLRLALVWSDAEAGGWLAKA